MTAREALEAAVEAGLMSAPLIRTILTECAEQGRPPSYVCGVTGGEPLSEGGKELVSFLEERGQ